MSSLIDLVENDDDTNDYLDKLLLWAGVLLAAMGLLPWGSLLGKVIFSWHVSDQLTVVLLLSAAVALVLGFLKFLPATVRAGVPAGLVLLTLIIQLVRSDAQLSISGGGPKILLGGWMVVGVILLGFGTSYWAVRPNTKLARAVIALGIVASLLGYLWPMSVSHGGMTFSLGVPLVYLCKGIGKAGFVSVALILLLLNFLASLASALLLLTAEGDARETRRAFSSFLSGFFVWLFPAVFAIVGLAILFSGIFLLLGIYMTVVIALYMLFLVRGALVVVIRLVPEKGQAGYVTGPAAVQQTAARPPVAQPPVAQPPVQPPVAKPPVQPPVAQPPVQPPVAQPPVAQPTLGTPGRSPVDYAELSPEAKRRIQIQRNLKERGIITAEQLEQRKQAIIDEERGKEQ